MDETGLILRIASDQPVGSLAAHIDRLSPDEGGAMSQPRRIESAATIGRDSFVACTPGLYVVTAFTPSGDVLREQVEVRAGEQTPVSLGRLTDTDWLDWQASSGALAARKKDNRLLTRQRLRLGLAIALGAGLLLTIALVLATPLLLAPPQAPVELPQVELPPSTAVQSVDAPPAVLAPMNDVIEFPSDFAETIEQQTGAIELGSPPVEQSPSDVQGSEPVGAVPASASAAPVSQAEGSPWLAGVFGVLFALIGFNLTGGLRRLVGQPERASATAHADVKEEWAYAQSSLRNYAEQTRARIDDFLQPSPLDDLRANQLLVCTVLSNRKAWETIAAATQRPGLLFADAHVISAPRRPANHDKARALFEIRPDELSLSSQEIAFCVTPLIKGRTAFGVLPLPWVSHEGTRPLEALSAFNAFGEPCLTVVARDPDYSTLLGYLARGDLPSARLLIDQEHSPEEPAPANPYAAAAIGYALMASARPSDDIGPWRAWIGRMHARFASSADLSILEAWCVLLADSPPGNVVRARALFLQAFEQGLPAFNEGLRRLRNGLLLFCSGSGPTLNEEKDLVERVLRRCEPNKAFTTIGLG